MFPTVYLTPVVSLIAAIAASIDCSSTLSVSRNRFASPYCEESGGLFDNRQSCCAAW